MTERFLMAIDEGTTGATALVVGLDASGHVRVVSKDTVEFPQHFPQSGWVEHDLNQVWGAVRQSVLKAVEKAAAGVPGFSARLIDAIGITNQRETLCLFDPVTSAPLRRAIVWQCRRSSKICDRLKADQHESFFRHRTGLVLDPYFTGTKLAWVMENEPSLAALIKDGKAAIGTIDTYLLHRLTSGSVHATEASNASRTLMFDIHKGSFDLELLKVLGIPSGARLPEVRDSAGFFGATRGLDFLPDGIPVAGMLGDQQAALAGQACYGEGEAKCTYGTGAFMLLNTGSMPKASKAGLLTTVAWSLKGRMTYALEGSAFIAGAAVQFVRDQLKFMASSADIENMARSVSAAPTVYFVPALAGLGAPYWDSEARGAFLGLTRGTSREQMCRAVLEGIAFVVNDVLSAMCEDLGNDLKVLRVDGGASANDLLMQTQADLGCVTVDRPKNLETTALGAALFAGLGVGIFSDLRALRDVRVADRRFEPRADAAWGTERSVWMAKWSRAVEATRTFGVGG